MEVFRRVVRVCQARGPAPVSGTLVCIGKPELLEYPNVKLPSLTVTRNLHSDSLIYGCVQTRAVIETSNGSQPQSQFGSSGLSSRTGFQDIQEFVQISARFRLEPHSLKTPRLEASDPAAQHDKL